MKTVLNKVNKSRGLIRKLRNSIPKSSQLILFKSFVKFHVCGDIMQDSYNKVTSSTVQALVYPVK